MISSLFGSIIIMILLEGLNLLVPRSNQVSRLLYLKTNEEIHAPQEFMQRARYLEKMINGRLYRKDQSGNVVEEASPLPTAGPFHVFLSHSKNQ